MDELEREIEPPNGPCRPSWDAYKEALGKAEEAEKVARPYIDGVREVDNQGQQALNLAIQTKQIRDDLFKKWRAWREAHGLVPSGTRKRK